MSYSSKDIVFDIETTGIDPLDKKITFVGLVSPYNTEGKVTIIYWDNVRELDDHIFEAFNYPNRLFFWARGEFDVPFLRLHAAKLGIYLDIRNAVNLATVFKQNCELLNGKHKSDFSSFFGIPHDEVDGSKMPQYYEDKKYDLIIDHLTKDLLSTVELYHLAKRMYLI